MKLKAEQLPLHCKTTLLPIYWLSGDDPLLLEEARLSIRDAAKQQGFDPDEIFTVTGTFNWQTVFNAFVNRSLFSEKRLIEVRLEHYKLGKTGSTLLKDYTQHPDPDVILLLTSHKLEKATFNTTYMKAVDAIGGIVQIWPIERQQLPSWLKTRLKQAHVDIEPQALTLFADCVEGNLLAAKQMIDRFALSHENSRLTEGDVETVLRDFTQFDVFALVDSSLSEDKARTLRIIRRLRDTGTEIILILWAVSREIRQLAEMALATQQLSVTAVFQRYRVWPKRQALLKRALDQHPLTHWYTLLKQAQQIDVMIKTNAQSNMTWCALEKLCVAMG